MSKLIEKYNLDLKKKTIIYDKNQETIIIELNNLSNTLILEKKKDLFFFSDVLNFFKKNNFLGLYIWGDVGRGKTYLVDLFYNTLPIKKKIRLHYHHFINLIHIKLKENFGKKNPLKIISNFFSKNYIILCLDEFFVKDIGDAMNLTVLLSYLFESGMFFVITSNIIPNKLYEGGLQRQKFLKTIYLIEKYLKIINIGGNIDFRLRNLSSENFFFFNLNYSTFKKMKNLFIKLSVNSFRKKEFINILGRKILVFYISGSIVWFDFKIICGLGRSQLDYIEIASIFDTVFISGIKKLTENNEDEAKRFISLIDEFYDKKVKIIISFECNIKNLYNGKFLDFDFKRTVSRLNEMSTINYLKESNKNVF